MAVKMASMVLACRGSQRTEEEEREYLLLCAERNTLQSAIDAVTTAIAPTKRRLGEVEDKLMALAQK
jgi:hypothetical protein